MSRGKRGWPDVVDNLIECAFLVLLIVALTWSCQ